VAASLRNPHAVDHGGLLARGDCGGLDGAEGERRAATLRPDVFTRHPAILEGRVERRVVLREGEDPPLALDGAGRGGNPLRAIQEPRLRLAAIAGDLERERDLD